MDTEALFNGVAVAIDDEVHDPIANISTIINQIEAVGIPVLKYTSLPDNFENIVGHFQNLSFLLLDWRLIKDRMESSDLEAGVTLPSAMQEYDASENIKFIKEVNSRCFCPIFLFTNEDTKEIKEKLLQEELIHEGKPSSLLVQSKNNLQDEGSLFAQLSDWLKQTPSIYALKEWEREYQNCKTRLFSDFHSISPSWPAIMWSNFEQDGANKSLELGELISRNLHSRMTPFEFNDEILKKGFEAPKEELRKVLEGERFLKSASLHKDDIGTGDIFKEEYTDQGQTKYRYFLNIRAQCDLLRTKKPGNTELYCLQGRVLDESQLTENDIIGGQFLEKINNSIVPFLDDGKIIEFLFRDIKPKKWKDLEDKRIGRLLPPFITRIQQRYSLYMQRQGLPRIPKKAIF